MFMPMEMEQVMKTVMQVAGWRIFWLACLLLAAGGIYGQADTAFVQPRDWLTGQREELPGWLTETVAEERFIAISDPGLKPQIAREQALLRAAFLCALRQGVKVEAVTDYFSNSRRHYEYELSGDKLVSLFRVETTLPSGGWRLGREWENRYGEYAVEVFPVAEDKRDSCYGRVTGELMLVSSGDYRERNEIRCVWTSEAGCPGRICHSNYLMKGNISALTVKTWLNDTLAEVPREGYWYTAGENAAADTAGESYTAYHGLWCAQMQSLLYVFARHPWPKVQTKVLGEGTATGINDCNLRRETVRSRLSVTAGPWIWKGNDLQVEWKTEDL